MSGVYCLRGLIACEGSGDLLGVHVGGVRVGDDVWVRSGEEWSCKTSGCRCFHDTRQRWSGGVRTS